MAQKDTDEQLLRAFVKGDRDALAQLAGRYEAQLLGLASGLLGSQTPACDAVQNAWVRVIRHGSTFNGSSSFKTWMYRITINCCRDLQAKRKIKQDDETLKNETDSKQSPEQDLLNRERKQVLHQSISKLNQAKRETLLLCYHDSMTHEKAAEVLDIPVGTLKSRLNAALNELRKLLAEDNIS
ncbi:MAG: RNA polymerase sigma factor [Planctomycetes bacterium]|nr:RNA polymerase sigma factor [Planctomycetota bacterium]